MAGFDIPTNDKTSDDHPNPMDRKVDPQSKTATGLFLFYVLFYAGFVGLNAFAPSVVERPFIGGINLAVVYGLALIGLAFVVALIYDWHAGRGPTA